MTLTQALDILGPIRAVQRRGWYWLDGSRYITRDDGVMVAVGVRDIKVAAERVARRWPHLV